MNRKQELRSVNEERPVSMFTFVQAMGLCAMAIVAASMAFCAVTLFGNLTAVPNYLLMDQLNLLDVSLWIPFTVLLMGAGTGGCLLWLLAEFVLMCGRVQKETAFTTANARALGRIALAFLIVGALLLPLGKPLMDSLMLGLRGYRLPVLWLLPSFAAWTAALLVRAIQVLLRRAVDMQTEQDLTI